MALFSQSHQIIPRRVAPTRARITRTRPCTNAPQGRCAYAGADNPVVVFGYTDNQPSRLRGRG